MRFVLRTSPCNPWQDADGHLALYPAGDFLRAFSHVVDPSLVAHIGIRGVVAFDYLLKNQILDTDDFLRSVERVAGGGTVIDLQAVNSHMAGNTGCLAVLTAREIQVLRLLATGQANTGCAEELLLSRRTVDAHLRSAFSKLDFDAAPAQNQRARAALDWLGAAHTEG